MLRPVIGNRKVKIPVPIKIANRYRNRKFSSPEVYRSLKRAIAIAREYGDGAKIRGNTRAAAVERRGRTRRATVDHNKIRLAITVKIRRRYGYRIGSDAIIDAGLEGAVTPAQQDRDVSGTRTVGRVLIGHGQVGFAVAVEVGCRYRNGTP